MTASTAGTVACQQSGCVGHYGPDGYCDECGAKAAKPTAVATTGTAGGACQQAGCAGHYGPDGYCEECGAKARAAAGASIATSAMPSRGLSTRTGAGLGGTSSGMSGTRSTRSRSAARGRLGAGLVDIPPVPLRDAATAVMSDPVVSESRRYCGKCDEPVGRGRDGAPGRAEGFCPHCGTPFLFLPTLKAGDLVDHRYEVLGCLAYGGLGWIYLARDRNVSEGGADRWVVLKGLINTGDPDAMESAVAERRFLVEVDHPNIVNIHDFARHPDPKTGELVGYIVMEYVGGQSLKELAMAHRGPTGQREPLPLPQVLAYGLEVLPALGYLHDRGVVFCDFKPDNVIQAEEQLKLIDLGAVRRIDDPAGAIYGTPGYQAPDVATHGPTVGSDLYTVGRTLAVLSFQFSGFSTRYAERLPAPEDVELFVREPSFHRLLLRATHPDPLCRFGSAAEMADQVLGVLREVLAAADGVPRPSISVLFTPERRAFGTSAGIVSAENDDTPGEVAPDGPAVAAALPVPLVDPADPGAGLLATVNSAAPAEEIAALRAAPTRSVEVTLALVRALLANGEVGAAGAELATLTDHDWRYDWHRGLHALVAGQPRDALAAFDSLASALPGEPAAQLAEAAAAELAGGTDLAIARYHRVWRVDHSYVSAAFGLARLLLRQHDRDDAIGVLDEVPDSSSQYVAAQIAAVRALLDERPGPRTESGLLDASARLTRLKLDPGRQARLAVELFTAALDWLGVPVSRGTAGRPANLPVPAPRTGTGQLLGQPLTERGLRLGLERALRALATLERDALTRYALVDRANAVRPRTLV